MAWQTKLAMFPCIPVPVLLIFAELILITLNLAKQKLQQTTIYFFPVIFRRKQGLMFQVNPLQAEDSHEISSLIFFENSEKVFLNVVCCCREWRLKG